MSTIRGLFAQGREIDREIEKVIDYAATDPNRLKREISEYYVTDRLRDSFRRFIEVYDSGVRQGDVTEVGIWVSGFYGSGKSSFTKYLGFALDPKQQMGDSSFLDQFCLRLDDNPLQRLYHSTATQYPATVVMLDLAREQLIESTAVPITNVLYAKVLQLLDFSKVPKIADVEVRLDEAGRLDELEEAYRRHFPTKGEWGAIHNDSLLAPARISQIMPDFFPDEFPTPESFRNQHYEERLDVDGLASRMIKLLRRRYHNDNIIFLVDEVGQYVAPRLDLMLNLDGLVRSFKEIGRGKVWMVATAQQKLMEIVSKAALNSAELYRLKDRFPISFELDAADIREITQRRLLTKSQGGEKELAHLWNQHGQSIRLHTQVEGFGSEASRHLDKAAFALTYPFLPIHFDVVMDLIRRLARRTGGTGLRSSIRVVQDLLVDASHMLPAQTMPLADHPLGKIACADDLYDTLRADIGKELPHVVEGVDRVIAHPVFGKDRLAIRVAKAIAALQPLDDFPRTAENLAALLYPGVGEPSLSSQVRDVLDRLVDVRDLGIVEAKGAQESDQVVSAGYLFLSDKVRPIQQQREAHRPTGGEKRQVHIDLLKSVFDPKPVTQLENVRIVSAGLWLDTVPIEDPKAEISFRLLPLDPSIRQQRIEELRPQTKTRGDWQKSILWVVTFPPNLDDLLTEICKSDHIVKSVPEHEAEHRDVSQYVRAERRSAERARETTIERLKASLLDGIFLFQAIDRPARELGGTIVDACTKILSQAAATVFHKFSHAAISARTDLAVKFLEYEQRNQMPPDRDPLRLVQVKAGRPEIRTGEPPLALVLRELKEKVDAAGTGRLQGSVLQDFFTEPPYGWSKDTTRYLFAALLADGAIELYTAQGLLRTPGPAAEEALRNTANFNRVGVAPRGARPSLEILDRASRVLEHLFGIEVLPLEDHISRAVRTNVPPLMERIGSLPDRLRLLGLQGEDQARQVLQSCSDLLRDDSGASASILGDPNSSLPTLIEQARKAADSLYGDRENLVRRASTLHTDLNELSQLFPELADLNQAPSLTTINEILASENFAQRMDDLQQAAISLEKELSRRTKLHQDQLHKDAKIQRDRLVSMAEWTKIEPEDQKEILSRLDFGTSQSNVDAVELRRALTFQARLLSLFQECRDELRRLAAPADTKDSLKSAEQMVLFRDLLPTGPLADRAALDRWIDQLRQRLQELVELGPVNIIDREKE